MESKRFSVGSETQLPLRFRRSYTSDAAGIAQLRKIASVAQCIPPTAMYPWKTESEFTTLIEQSVISITAISTVIDKPVGFICLDDTPHTTLIPGDSWEVLLDDSDGDCDKPLSIFPCNTLWVKAVLVPTSTALMSDSTNMTKEDLDLQRKLLLFGYSSEALLQRFLHIALDNLPSIEHLLVPCPMGQTYRVFENIGFRPRPLQPSSFNGTVLHIKSVSIVPQLLLRLGIVEDYDDFVVRILGGDGLITSLPEEFYLDELLKDQNSNNKVIVAEDAVTHRVAGIMCLEASIEDQQMISRQYYTELYGKLRPMRGQRNASKGAVTSNMVRIKFFYIDPAYALRAKSFLPVIYKEFPFVEYVIITLPYDTEKPPFLGDFDHVPLRKYYPRNSEGYLIPPPDGLWINCRYAADPVVVAPVRSEKDITSINVFLDEPHMEFSQHQIALLREDIQLLRSGRETPEDVEESNINSFVFSFVTYTENVGSEKQLPIVVGVASARKISVNEMYSLRANYDLDKLVNYYSKAPRDYSETDVTLSSEEGRRKFFRNEVRGLLVRSFYVRPVYRSRISFLMRELLRHTDCELALLLEDNASSPFTTLLHQLLRIQPRRVVEKPRPPASEPVFTPRSPERIPSKDVAPLGCLFAATRRTLGDRKKLVHTRIIVVGAGSTGLTFLYRLLTVPYICFTNLVLISTDGMPEHPNQQQNLWSTDRMELLEREHMGLTVGNPIRVIHGSMVDIETAQRYVVVDDSTYEPYDYVILTTGRQFGVPLSISSLQQPVQQRQQLSRTSTPPGVLPISGSASVERLQRTLYELDRNPENVSNIVVYGSGLDAFAIATSIINLGFSPQRMVLVSPDVTNPFVDKDAFECVVRMWSALGANTMHGYKISRTEYDDDGTTLTTVVLSPVPALAAPAGPGTDSNARSSVEINCSLIVCCEDKDIDSNVLSTLNRRSIVFDGRVTVESNYLTTNPCVYATGPVAMFTRRYGTTTSFDEFNARDVGTNLAEVILGTLGFEEFATPNLQSCTDKENELLAAHNELYSKVLDENGSRNANYGVDLNSLSAEKDAHEIAKQNQLKQQQKLPVYTTPVASRIRLPGKYVFFSTMRIFFDPAQCTRLYYSCIEGNKPYVDDITASYQVATPADRGSIYKDVEQDLLVIYLNKHTRLIDAVVYFGNGSPETHNYMCLIGLPHSLLNLIFRYNEARTDLLESDDCGSNSSMSGSKSTASNKIDIVAQESTLNLMEYLRSPRLQVVFYDRFVEFYENLRKKMQEHEDVMKMKQSALQRMEVTPRISAKNRAIYLEKLTEMQKDFARRVQYELIKFLHESKEYLPQIMYLPDITEHVEKNEGRQE